MDLATMRGQVRKDLHDEDAANYRWTDAVLERHIARAVEEYSEAVPYQAYQDITAVADTRAYSLISYTYLKDRPDAIVRVCAPWVSTAVWSEARWRVWNNTLYLLDDTLPVVAGDIIRIFYGRRHTLDAACSTIPQEHEPLIALGAGAFAALEWANYATSRINVGGGWTPKNYREWAEPRLVEFQVVLVGLELQRAMGEDGRVSPLQAWDSWKTI
jgi:hypothetical protein